MSPLVALVLALAGPAAAQEPAPEPEPEPGPGPRLPVLESLIPAAYPERALERAIEGDVLLELTVDETGYVVEVALLEEAGHGFDAPAAEAAFSMRFAPALDEKGQPVAAKIRYRYAFRMGDVAPLSVEGVVREKGAKRVLANAYVRAAGPDDVVARTRSDDQGRFRFAELPPGQWVLTVSGSGLLPSSASVNVPEDGYAEAIVLQAERIPEYEDIDVDEEIEVTASRSVDPAEVELSHDVVVTLPGSLGDPVRALQNLPGVARAPFGSGQLMVRGTTASDTAYLANGTRIPIAFHFTAVSTVIAADLLDAVEFQPGGFGARYGRALGGVVDLKIDDSIPKKASSSASADVFQATAFTHQRLGKATSLVLSARRSYIDAIAQPILASMGAGALKVPRYYDAQLHLVRALPDQGLVSGTLLLSEDRFRVLGTDGGDVLSYRTAFQKGIARWLQPLPLGWWMELSGSVGPEIQELELSGDREEVARALGVPFDPFGDIDEGVVREEAVPRYSLRHEYWRDPGDDVFGGRLGVDWVFGPENLEYTVADPEAALRSVSEPGLYAESTVRLGPLDLVPGVRWEMLDMPYESIEHAVDPRFRAILDLGPTKLTTTYGRYSQPPATRELLSEEGRLLGFEHSEQVSAGVDQRLFGPDGKLGVTAYWQRLWGLVVGREGLFRFDQTSLTSFDDFGAFANDGIGTGYGLEVFASYTTDERIVWLSATFSRAVRTDRPWESEHPAETDQPVNLTLIGSQALGHWRAGARVRYATGPAMTPVHGGVYATDLQTWLPLYGVPYSERAPAFFALDVRLDREWWFRQWQLAFYAEVQNATNHVNVEVAGWSEDYSRPAPVTGLPVFPAIGLKASW